MCLSAASSPSCPQSLFVEHAINSGRVLLALNEQHLREMGVAKIGHRLEILGNLGALKRRAVPVATEDLGTLVLQ